MKEFFEPVGVAVVGASREPGKLGHEILRNIIDAGYGGGLYPINPKSPDVLGLKCYTSVKEIPGQVDLAVIVVPSRFVPSIIADCGVKGVKAAIIISGGFRETGDAGAQIEKQLMDAAKAAGVRIIGPNCQGVNSTASGLCATWPLVKVKGPISVVSQSGTVVAAIGCWAENDGIGVSKLVALGNKCDVDEIELLEYFEQDKETKVIGLYIEGTRDGRKFIETAKRITKQKPVVVLKGGRTEKGMEAAQSHTKSIAGLDRVFDAAFKKAGIIRANSIDEMYDACKAMSTLPPPAGANVSIITSSGGSGILATDACEEIGLKVVDLPVKISEELKQKLPPECIIRNPLDLTGSATSQLYDEVLSTILPSDVVNSAIVIIGDPMPGITDVIEKHLRGGKPIIPVMLGGGKAEDEEFAKMASRKIAAYRSPSRGAQALASLFKYSKTSSA